MSYYIRKKCVRRILEICVTPQTFKECLKVCLEEGAGRKTVYKLLEEMIAGDLLERSKKGVLDAWIRK